MATIVGVTALDLSKAKKAELCDKVAHGVVDAFNLDFNVSMMMLLPVLPIECHGPSVTDSITYWIYTAPNKTVEQKRQVVEGTILLVGPLEVIYCRFCEPPLIVCLIANGFVAVRNCICGVQSGCYVLRHSHDFEQGIQCFAELLFQHELLAFQILAFRI